MAVLKFDEETETILKANGLKCICQLCDCGRVHKHVGCRVKHASNITSSGGKVHLLQTDYQDRFRCYENVEAVKPIIPIENPRNLNPPPMDLRTENQMSFKDFGPVEKIKPCIMKQELDRSEKGKFQNKSLYEESFIGYQPKPLVTSRRPNTVIKQNKTARCFFETEYQKGYYPKEKVPQEKYFEKPVEADILIYPKDNLTFPKQSLKNSVHSGQPGEKAKTCVPKKTNIHLGFDEEFDYATTKSIEFKQYDNIQPPKNKRPVPVLRPSGKFHGTSTSRNEFVFNESDALKGRGQICSEYPSLIKISMDIPTNFKTVSNMSYNNWDPKIYKRKQHTKQQERYTPPKQKFQTETQSMLDFKDHGVVTKTYPLKPDTARKSSVKLDAHSCYDLDYPNHGSVQRKIYGEQHFDNLTLPSRSFKLENASVMRSDFRRDLPIVKTKSCKPLNGTYTRTGVVDKSTEYTDMFKPNVQEQCTFTKYLLKNQLK